MNAVLADTLTGKDGAAELKLLKQRGALTLVQDKDTSVVHGMPGEVVAIGAASYVLPPDKIADALGNLSGRTVASGAAGYQNP